MSILTVLLGQSVVIKRRKTLIGYLHVILIILILQIHVLYFGSFNTELVLSPSPIEINTIDDVVNSNITLRIPDSNKDYLDYYKGNHVRDKNNCEMVKLIKYIERKGYYFDSTKGDFDQVHLIKNRKTILVTDSGPNQYVYLMYCNSFYDADHKCLHYATSHFRLTKEVYFYSKQIISSIKENFHSLQYILYKNFENGLGLATVIRSLDKVFEDLYGRTDEKVRKCIKELINSHSNKEKYIASETKLIFKNVKRFLIALSAINVIAFVILLFEKCISAH